MGVVRPQWHRQPDPGTVRSLQNGARKLRRSQAPKHTDEEIDMATKAKKKAKKTTAKKGAPKRKLDGKALAAARKPRDTVAKFIKDELEAGRTDVDKIIEKATKEFPSSKPTRGYVRFIAKQIGKYKQVAPEVKDKPAKKASKKKAKKGEADGASAAATDPAT